MIRRILLAGLAVALAVPTADALETRRDAPLPAPPLVPTLSYPGPAPRPSALAVLGTLDKPDMTHAAAAVWQKVSGTDTPGNNGATYTSIVKTTAARGANATGAFIEASDLAGGRGTYTEGLDARCVLRADTGTCGNVLFAATDAGVTVFGNLIGSESVLIDNTGADQPVFGAFNPDHEATGFLASNTGPSKADAGFVVNGNNAAPFRTGFPAVGKGVGSGAGVDDTGFAASGGMAVGLSLARGTFAAAAIVSPGFAVGPAGEVSAASYRAVLTTPASSSAACTAGQFSDDAHYHYVCVGPSHWRRVALSDF